MNFSKILERLKRYDYSFFGLGLAIFLIGILNLYSATHSSAVTRMAELYKTQLGWFGISLAVGVIVSFISSKNFFRLSYLSYLVVLICLTLVLALGHTGMGAQRWLVLGPIRFQPSEFMKIAVVLALAKWLSGSGAYKGLGLKELVVPFILAIIPTVLIAAEPDLGTGLLIMLIFAMVVFYRKVSWKTLGVLTLVGAISGAGLYLFGLKEYQKRRIVTFLNPASDAKGSGYNAIQSKIAIGSGKFFGKGFKKSSQASFNYLPENHTDFVFSIFNEEHGLFGSIVLIGLYFLIFVRFLWLASSVSKIFDAIVVIGLMSIFFWHTIINMGMVMGLLPIVGLPLPLMSYGGSSLLTFCICLGMATSISNSRTLF